MIADSLDNLFKYSSKYGFISDIVSFLKNNDLASLPFGKTFINDVIYLNKESYYGKESKEALFESHHHHIDIQVVLEGREIIETTVYPIKIGNYNSDLDIIFSEGDDRTSKLFVDKGLFLLLEANEWHKPCIKVNDDKIIKIVFKINLLKSI